MVLYYKGNSTELIYLKKKEIAYKYVFILFYNNMTNK